MPQSPQAPPIRVEIPNLGIVEFPAGTSEQQMTAAIQAQLGENAGPGNSAPRSGFATIADAFRLQYPQFAGGMELVTGAAKGAANTVLGLTQLINKGTAKVGLSTPIDPSVFRQARQDFATPSNPLQQAGYTGEQVGEFFLPGGAVARGAKAVEGLVQGARYARPMITGTRGLLEGASGAAIHSAQTGSTEGAPSVALAGAVGATAAPAIGKALSNLGQKVEGWLVSAGKQDLAHGFKIGNIFKYGLGGSVQDTLTKSDSKLRELSGELRAELHRLGPSGQTPMVDVLSAITDAERELSSKAAKTTGQNAAIQRAFDNIKSDIQAQSGGTGVVTHGVFDLPTANEIKQGIGDFGAWQYGRTDADANATEIVANTIYSKLRTAIENAAPNGTRIQELNRAIGDIIPIRQAIMRRIPVVERQRVVGLGDMLAMMSGNWWIPATDRVMRSGQAAQALTNMGTRLQSGRSSGAGAAAAASQIKR